MRRLWLASACLAVVAGVAVNLVSDSVSWRLPLWILLAVAVGATAGAAWFGRPRRTAVEERDPVEALAEVVGRQWETEAGIREVLRPDPLPVRWSTTGRPVRARAATFRLSGTLDGVAEAFLSLPRRQLLILGDPGGGKSVLAMLLTLALLRRREPGDPVPVLVPVASWNPVAQELDAWLAARLAADYPGLGPARDAVLPILDGLDELPKTLLPQAIDGIDRAMAGGRPVVVTCRGAEYEAAVAAGGIVLSGAAVVELEPVTPTDALDYITARSPVGDTRWEPVSACLAAHPDGDLAAALSSPLLVWLAGQVYAGPTTDPAGLLDLPDRSAIERHLLTAIIPARYGRSSEQATRWLSALARHQRRTGTRDLAWWDLYRWTGPVTIRLTLAALMLLMVGGVGGLVGLATIGPFPALLSGLVFGLTAAGFVVVVPLPVSRGPVNLGAQRRGLAGRIARYFAGGYTMIMAMLLSIVIIVGLAGGLEIPLADSIARVVLLGSIGGVFFGLITGLLGWLTAPVTGPYATTPRSTLREDRVVVVTQSLVGAVVVGVPMGLMTGMDGTGFGVTMGLQIAIAVALFIAFARTASSWYFLAHFLLALRGKLPWRLMRFLDDAHRRGILRQSGPTYEFRHALLRDHLAGPA